MSAPLVIGVPSKGRLQENASAFFESAGMPVRQAGGARGYVGTIAGLDGVAIAFLSAAEIARNLAQGAIHLGVTGEDLVRETIAEAGRLVELVAPLGFGYTNVVVAVPQAWIDVSTMADLDDVAAAYYARRRRRMRVATKYVNLTRAFFARHGIADYRIVESPGATEGTPGAGSAELIVDITTTGATLAANALKVLDDGVILKSQANLVAALAADWSAPVRAALAEVLSRISARERARAVRELRFSLAGAKRAAVDKAVRGAGGGFPFAAARDGLAVAHCPAGNVYALVAALRRAGVGTVSVSRLDNVFEPDNPLYARLAARLDRA